MATGASGLLSWTRDREATPEVEQRRREEAERRLAEALAEIDRLAQRRG